MSPPSQRFLFSPLSEQMLSEPGANLVIAEWTAEGCEPGAEPVKIAPLHIHRQDDEAWYVLEGTLGFQIGDTTLEAHPNDAVLVPRGMPHTYWNPRPEPARYLIVMTSRISALIDAIHAASERNPETMKQLFARYESELPD
ncbi:cupin domain-containing protein [Cohnella zeiphila]|uniref:cupin domain-containing protein n=1 Tax=Cohnella zeiphila TaxID=2761120 RepID=UPI001EE252A1|nr:cupin domain-containing protein [Cohnella zeiphila]